MHRDRARWIVAWVTLVLIYVATLSWSEAARPEFFTVSFAALSAFVGSYVVLEGQPEQPTTAMAIGLVAALLTTFGTALLVALQLSRHGWRRLKAASRSKPLVVVGSSEEAEQIARSIPKNRLIRVQERPLVADGDFVVHPAVDPYQDGILRRVLGSAESVIVAASTDRESVRLARGAAAHTRALVLPLVRSTLLARAMSARALRELPRAEVFHPADRVGQTVAEIVSRAQHDDGTRLRLVACGTSAEISAVSTWLDRSRTANEILRGGLDHILVGEGEAATLLVFVGEADHVAMKLADQAGTCAIVAVADLSLLRLLPLPDGVALVAHADEPTRQPSPQTVVVVDPVDTLNYRSVRNGIAHQWGRAFADAYDRNGPRTSDAPPARWRPDVQGKVEQSSIAAAHYMLKNLADAGYHLELGAAGWQDGEPAPAVLDRLARAEHDDWKDVRTFVDSKGIRRSVTERLLDGTWQRGPLAVAFDDLPIEAQEFNLAVVRRVYPALAAMFGYGIVRSGSETSLDGLGA